MRIGDAPELDLKKKIVTLDHKSSVLDAAMLMREHNIGAVPIVEDRRLVGVFTERDVLCRVYNGRLDLKNTPIAEVMTKNPDTVLKTTPIIDAVKMTVDRGYRHLLVVDESGFLEGILSHRDLITVSWLELMLQKHKVQYFSEYLLDEVLKSKPDNFLVSLSPSALVSQAIDLMASQNLGSVPVLVEGKIRGIFTERDIIMRLIPQNRRPETVVLSDVMTENPQTVTLEMNVEEVLQMMIYGKYRHLPLVNDRGIVNNLLSLRDFIRLICREAE